MDQDDAEKFKLNKSISKTLSTNSNRSNIFRIDKKRDYKQQITDYEKTRED